MKDVKVVKIEETVTHSGAELSSISKLTFLVPATVFSRRSRRTVLSEFTVSDRFQQIPTDSSMKLILLIVVSCLALHNGKGAPRNAVYKFVRCNPSGDQANCVTQQTAEMDWSPDLAGKLPASSARLLEAEAVEDESPLREEEDEEAEEEAEEEEAEEEEEEAEEEEEEDEERWEEDKETEEEEWENEEDEKMPLVSEEAHFSEGGSGDYEGSADASVSFGDIGSGDAWTKEDMAFVGESRPSEKKARPAEQELQEEHLLSS